eukprot:160654-Chlamydomonas_euryale.AAC.8
MSAARSDIVMHRNVHSLGDHPSSSAVNRNSSTKKPVYVSWGSAGSHSAIGVHAEMHTTLTPPVLARRGEPVKLDVAEYDSPTAVSRRDAPAAEGDGVDAGAGVARCEDIQMPLLLLMPVPFPLALLLPLPVSLPCGRVPRRLGGRTSRAAYDS